MDRRFLSRLVMTVVITLAAAPRLHSQAGGFTKAQLDSARAAAADVRKQTVAANMMLGAAEAKAFWPVYDAYRAEMGKIREKEWNALHQIATAPDSLTDAKVNYMTNMWLSLKMDEEKLRASYFPKFQRVLKPKQVARYFQIEHRLDLLVQLAVAQEIPLVY